MTNLAIKNMSITIDLALRELEALCDHKGIHIDSSDTYRSICARLTDMMWDDESMQSIEMDDWWELIDRIADLKASLFNR